ncbi:hypothetical protein PR003_g9744 [Phytophthora rubi]|uniref:PH domain-containing protein n=2 Tax=Phytophthora rubi TaxID=129364 RepID=A0A6A3MJX8_9STRA|nr:hypothetical protein PR001_g10358 [Phytophthora rubi]KAE9341909.1 hypothetical protein PR003_g9744 [Phytophthora rubi]
MGLGRRAKAAESAPAASSSSTSRLLAFFSHRKQDPDEAKRRHGRLKPKHKRPDRRSRSRSRSFEDDDEAPSSPANVRLCQFPGGRANVQLAVRVARDATTSASASGSPPSCVGVFPQRSSSLQYSTRSSSSSSRSSGSSLHRERRQNLIGISRDHDDLARRRARSSSLDSSSSESESGYQDAASAATSPANFQPREMWRESSVDEFLSCFPRDLTADVRATCNVVSPRASKRFVRGLIVSLEFEIRATKWAAYFLQIVHTARQQRRVSLRTAVSVKWAICAHVQGVAHARQEQQKRSDLTLQRKMTEYRVALQCVAGTGVVKFGRKGKPHATTLCVENGDTLRWTSKLLAHATHMAVDGVTATTTMGKKRVKAKNAIPLASILRVTSGPTTSVLARALHKGTLVLDDAGCTLSVVTHTRTLDLKAKSAEEREWLQRSLEFLVDLARDHERRVAQQVELTIMKRMETLPVWKYGRKGRPHKTRVFVDRFGEVSWLGRSGDSLQLDEIISVQEGHHTPVFARARAAGKVSAAKAAHCFSLVTSLRTLDIEAINEQQRDWFVVAFRYLLDKVHEKTAAMQRERAERQLRMLQDLCREDEEENYLTGDGDDDMYYDDCPPARHA